MKKSLYIFMALPLLALAGCSQETTPDSIPVSGKFREFTAGFSGAGTRTRIASEGLAWRTGDRIASFTYDGGPLSEHVVPSYSLYTKITVPYSEEDTFITSVYGASLREGSLVSELILDDAVMAEQSGRFEDAHVCVAHNSDLEQNILSFKNITSLISFRLNRSDFCSAVFTANGGEQLCSNDGSVTVEFPETAEVPVAYFTGDGSSSITVSLDGSGIYYIATLPVTLAEGFTLEFYDAAGILAGKVSSSNKLELGRNTICRLNSLDNRVSVAPTPLDLEGTANCYIVSEPGFYSFDATVKGCGPDALEPAFVGVLWETNGTNYSQTVGEVVSGVSLDEDGRVSFTANGDGDAVIAAYDAAGTIIWSWHIWKFSGFDPLYSSHVYFGSGTRVMDRNLGALSTVKGDRKTCGLQYQWGRKDPFPGYFWSATGGAWPSGVTTSAECTVYYAIQNPRTFIAGTSKSKFDWLYAKRDNTLWQDEKTIYDPCPPGWQIPQATLWSDAVGQTTVMIKFFDSDNLGDEFAGILANASSVWYPASGERQASNASGQVMDYGRYGFYWTTGISGNFIINAAVFFNDEFYPSKNNSRSYGCNVRCVASPGVAPVALSSIRFDRSSLRLETGDKKRLLVSYYPENATDKKLQWSSGDENVATVNEYGVVRAVAPGSCTVTAKSVLYGCSAGCTVTVVEPETLDLTVPAEPGDSGNPDEQGTPGE